MSKDDFNFGNDFGNGFDDSDDFGFDDSFGDSFDDSFGDSFENSDDTLDSDDSYNDDTSQDGGFLGGFNNSNSNNGSDIEDKKSIIKTSIIVIVVGILIAIGTFAIMNVIKNKTNPENKPVVNEEIKTDTENNVYKDNQTGYSNSVEVSNENKHDIQGDNQEVTKDKDIDDNDKPTELKPAIDETVNSDGGWVEIKSYEDISFNGGYIDSVFTITNIKHYVKVIDSENNIVVKTLLRGNLSGFTGTYELEVSYKDGNQLSIGNRINVMVQLGSYKGKVVVGEIKK